MIEWAHPLWLLALPIALLTPWIQRNPRMAVSGLDAIQGSVSTRRLLAWVPGALGAVGIGMLIVALARPQAVHRRTVVQQEGIDILLVLDTSGSMEAEDYRLGGRDASRLEVAKETIARFAEGRPNDRLGLVVFGEEAFTQVPLTTDHSALVRFLRLVRIGMAGQRATAVGDAIAVASKRLTDLDAPSRVAILLTDGRSNAGQVDPRQAAAAAQALGVKVYTIGVGSTDGRGGGLFGLLGGRSSDLDEETLQAIAATTDARYFRAGDTRALAEVYATIDALETSTAEVEELVQREERFRPWATAGLALLLMQFLLGNTILRRLP